jgi:enoyl-[acyl-carrier protein] reductase II
MEKERMQEPVKTKITDLFQICYPIVQGGMAWVSGWKLAAAVSNAGGLGLIGSASMSASLLDDHLQKLQSACDKPFGVNITLAEHRVEDIIDTCIERGVKVVFSSAGSPKKYTPKLKEAGITVVHVVPSAKLAQKVEAAGCDAVVAEGVESGGHAGFDEITSICLWPKVADAVSIPVIAAGGIFDGRGMAAALALGAEGVQIGTRFALTEESSASRAYKEAALAAGEADTRLYLRKYMPTRSLVNDYVNRAVLAEKNGASLRELKEIRGYYRAKNGIFEGDLAEGDLEIGQNVGSIDQIFSATTVVQKVVEEYRRTVGDMAR